MSGSYSVCPWALLFPPSGLVSPSHALFALFAHSLYELVTSSRRPLLTRFDRSLPYCPTFPNFAVGTGFDTRAFASQRRNSCKARKRRHPSVERRSGNDVDTAHKSGRNAGNERSKEAQHAEVAQHAKEAQHAEEAQRAEEA